MSDVTVLSAFYIFVLKKCSGIIKRSLPLTTGSSTAVKDNFLPTHDKA